MNSRTGLTTGHHPLGELLLLEARCGAERGDAATATRRVVRVSVGTFATESTLCLAAVESRKSRRAQCTSESPPMVGLNRQQSGHEDIMDAAS